MTTTTLELTVSPDFAPDHIAGWYVFNTWLQRKLGERIHLELFDSFEEQRRALAADRFDLMYANAHDAAMLVREKGFVALAAPQGKSDEAVIAVASESAAQCVEDLAPGLRLAATRDPNIELIGRILLEAADLDAGNTTVQPVSSYVLVAKYLLMGRADAGIFQKDAFDSLSAPTRRQLRVLVSSEISVVRHVLLAGPRCAALHEPLRALLLGMHAEGSDGRSVLTALGMSAWETQDAEDTEFMIDLVDALKT
jgi:phosphonate transport system substrate-binding protein